MAGKLTKFIIWRILFNVFINFFPFSLTEPFCLVPLGCLTVFSIFSACTWQRNLHDPTPIPPQATYHCSSLTLANYPHSNCYHSESIIVQKSPLQLLPWSTCHCPKNLNSTASTVNLSLSKESHPNRFDGEPIIAQKCHINCFHGQPIIVIK